MSELTHIFDTFGQTTALVIGDVMLDAYVWGKVDRISPEAPVPILQANNREARLGGAANVALNIQALGAKPILCAVIGDDQAGAEMLAILEEQNLSTEGILTVKGRKTTVKQRVLSGSHHLLRIDSEDTDFLAEADAERLTAIIQKLLPKANVVVFEDYDKGVISPDLISEVVSSCQDHGIPTAVDPKVRNFLAYRGVTLFKPNLKELREGLGIAIKPNDIQSLNNAVALLKSKLGISGALITLSEHGMYLDLDGYQQRIKAHLRNIADVSGAGDTVIAVAALCLAVNVAPPLLLELSNLSGGLVCEHVGVVPINKEDLLQEAQTLLLAKELNY